MQTEFITTIQKRRPRDFRCQGCGRKLGRGTVVPGQLLSIRCPRCGRTWHADIPINTTAVVEYVYALTYLNGSTPASLIEFMRGIVEEHGGDMVK